jgi:serine/threonine protein kinase
MVQPLPETPGQPAHETAPIMLVDGRIVAGRYRLGALIGRGAQGEVYKALQIDLERPVALKLLRRDASDEARQRLLREAQITAELKHPGVAVVYDAGITPEGQPYCAMELLKGETLAERVRRDGRVAAEELVPIAAGICSALSAVHGKKLLHRDVKPSNVFLAQREDGGSDPKLIDFGVAKSFAVDAPQVLKRSTLIGLGKRRTPIQTVPGMIVGTPVYLSPEQIRGDVADARSDVYSLSVTLYEALTGTPPFDDAAVTDLLVSILHDEPEDPAKRMPDAEIPAPIAAVVLRGLAKDPADRHASASDLGNALWGALAEAKGARPPSHLPGELSSSGAVRLPVTPARWPYVVALLAAAVLLLLALRMRPPASAAAPVAPPPSAPVAAAPSAAAPAPSATAVEAPAVPVASAGPPAAKSARPRASQAPAFSAAPAALPPAPSSTGFRIDDLKTPF